MTMKTAMIFCMAMLATPAAAFDVYGATYGEQTGEARAALIVDSCALAMAFVNDEVVNYGKEVPEVVVEMRTAEVRQAFANHQGSDLVADFDLVNFYLDQAMAEIDGWLLGEMEQRWMETSFAANALYGSTFGQLGMANISEADIKEGFVNKLAASHQYVDQVKMQTMNRCVNDLITDGGEVTMDATTSYLVNSNLMLTEAP